MKYNQFYTTVEFDFYITPTEYSFWQNNVRRRKLSRLEPHCTPRINVCETCYTFYDLIHALKRSHSFRPRNAQVHTRLYYGSDMEGALDQE
jgi:hypothetical protein